MYFNDTESSRSFRLALGDGLDSVTATAVAGGDVGVENGGNDGPMDDSNADSESEDVSEFHPRSRVLNHYTESNVNIFPDKELIAVH